MVPLIVTATTPHGVVLARPWGMALDGLLASVLWHRRKWAARSAGQPIAYRPEKIPETVDLPLRRCGGPEQPDWHWLATFADLHPRHAERPIDSDIRWRTSRTDHTRLQHLAPAIGRQVVSDRAGRYQARTVPVIAHPASTVTWRAVGDPVAIADLLEELPSIGKHRGVGEGVVTHWEITEAPELTEWEAGHEHCPAVLGRSVPRRCLTEPAGRRDGLTTIRPPYLHPASRTPGYLPDR